MAEHKFKIGERVYFHSRSQRELPPGPWHSQSSRSAHLRLSLRFQQASALSWSHASSSSNALASFRSRVSNPSVNQP
jgi:hypothetical protein